MPIIIRGRDLPMGWDDNRREVINAPPDQASLAKGICAIVDRANLEGDGLGGFKVKSAGIRTLQQNLRSDITAAVNKRKVALLQAYANISSHEDFSNDKRTVDAFSWPDPDKIDLVLQYADQLAVASGTGFYIGDGLVATAGHVLGAHEDLVNMRLVFDFSGDLRQKKFPATDVFGIERVLLYTHDRRLVDPNHSDLSLNAEYERGSINDYDICILKLSGIPRGIPILQLSDRPPPLKAPIYTIGCPKGLSFKHAAGGKVLRLPNEKEQPWQQGTLAADIDVFKGNSGSPLIEAFSTKNLVVGIINGAALIPYSDVTISQLYNEISKWVEYRKKINQGLLFAPPGAKPIEQAFLNTYNELHTFSDNTKATWHRFEPDRIELVEQNTATRTDIYANFLRTIASFQDRTTGLPSGEVSINLQVIMEPANPIFAKELLNDTLYIELDDGLSNPARGEMMVNPFGGFSCDEKLHWNLKAGAPVVDPTKPGWPDDSGLPHEIRFWPRGLSGLNSVTVRRLGNPMLSQLDPGYSRQYIPETGIITVTYRQVEDASKPPMWHAATYKFRVGLKFKPIEGHKAWKAFVGGRPGDANNESTPWEGPVKD